MVAAGGAIGCCLRYGVGLMGGISNTKGLGTFIVNVAGCFVIGALFSLSSRWEFAEHWRVFLFVGLLGGFTTFSSYALEILNIIQQGEIIKAVVYFVATNLLGLLAACVGMILVSFIAKIIA